MALTGRTRISAIAEWFGIARSVAIYWRPGRQRGLRELYAPFVSPGDLVFDIGAHLGDRSAAFAALGARVIALEPQPHLLPWLRRFVRRYEHVKIRCEAVGAAPGNAQLAISLMTPTVSTVGALWRHRMGTQNPGFGGVRWGRTLEVRVTTLDALIATFGEPRFCKIDVEGYEAEALAGLSRPLEGLSVEFVRGAEDIAIECLNHLTRLGPYEYNVVPGENRHFLFESWMKPDRARQWLAEEAEGFSSGDLYARRVRGA